MLQEPTIESVLELSLDDLGLLPLTNSQGSGAAPVPTVKTLRDSHHAVARLLARGHKDIAVAHATGYTPARIGQLKADPTFQNLVEHYRSDERLARAELTDRLLEVNLDVLQEIQRRLDAEPETFVIRDLLETLRTTADRSGYGPKSTTDINLNVGMADRLEQARQRVLASRSPLIESVVEDL